MVTTLVLKLVNIDRPWLELQLFEKLFRKTIIDEVSVELPLNPSVTNLTESFDSVLDISKWPYSLEPAERVVQVE